jgi:geranylgeranyl transferase type-2 subunit beta
MLLPLAGSCTPLDAAGKLAGRSSSELDGSRLKNETFKFIQSCAREDGGYSPSPDRLYSGNSDTAVSDLAAVTYAATLANPEGWELSHRERSSEFIQLHQQPDGVFVNFQGSFDPKSDRAVQYNTLQGVVGLRALGMKPKVDPEHVMDRFFEKETFRNLPIFTSSFYPLFYAALGAPFPQRYQTLLKQWMIQNQAADGYVGNYVAATFHMVHFFRLIGEPTPKAANIVQRVLRDQQADGGWQLTTPPSDVHACFDAVFILRQLGNGSEPCQKAISRAADWALKCRNGDGGFGHYPGWHSDMDAVYFQVGTLIQAGRFLGTNFDLVDAETLGWGHVMKPGKNYVHP